MQLFPGASQDPHVRIDEEAYCGATCVAMRLTAPLRRIMEHARGGDPDGFRRAINNDWVAWAGRLRASGPARLSHAAKRPTRTCPELRTRCSPVGTVAPGGAVSRSGQAEHQQQGPGGALASTYGSITA